jgi:class 3 adenylate cyclase/tetratricopeptide (TPR) repeat protein
VTDPARALGAYLPQDRRHALAGGEPVPERQRGAVAFADLSGFTALTERLSERLGPLRGAEELGAWLRRLYEPLIAAVEDEGGTVLGFAGDSITCLFPDDDGARAVRAADRMQDEVARLEQARAADGERIGVRLKVAIAVGPVRRFVVGDPELRLWDVMAGSTLRTTAQMESEAMPGDIVADAAAARAAGREPHGRRGDHLVLRRLQADAAPRAVDVHVVGVEGDAAKEDDAPERTRVAPAGAAAYRSDVVAGRGDRLWPDRDTAAIWAPAVARERAEEGADALGDFRPAGALFLAFGGIDWDRDEDAGARLDRFVRRVQRILDGRGGTLVQITVGDKGAYLYAAFGAPRAQGDDAARAVATALELVALEGPEIGDVSGLAAGVAYGAMYTGAYGATSRTTYGVLGPKTNLAARLMVRAGVGEVLCDPEAARRARRSVRFSALPPEPFKGVAQPVALQRAERVLAEHERGRAPMFGRDEERFDAGGLLSRAHHGDGGYLRWDGEPGVGKSRFLAWIAESAEARGMTVLRGSASSGGEGGYGLFRGPFKALLEVPYGAEPERLREALERAGSVADDATVSAVGALVAPRADEAMRDGAARRDAVAAVARDLLQRALARGPVVLLLDDVQAAQEQALDLLGRLAPLMKDAPLAIVAAGRPAGGATERELERALGPARRMRGLEAEASRMLIAAGLDVPAMAVPYAVSTAIHERAVGTPVLVEEIVRDLVERGKLRVERSFRGIGRAARGRAPAESEVKVVFDPQALRDLEGGLDALLLARIDRLTASERTAMRTAAVLGETAEHDPLAHLLDQDPAALDAALVPLEGPDMLMALEGAHRFQQAVLRTSAYENLLYEQRRALHRRMSQWYLERLEAGHVVDPVKMAYHFFNATEGEDDPELVVPALRAMEDLARRQDAAGAYEEALETLAKADRLVPQGPAWDAHRARIALRQGRTLERTGQRRRAGEAFRDAVEAARRGEAPALEAEAHGGLATLALHYGELDAAADAAVRARRLADASGDPAARGAAELTAARVAQATRDPDAAARHARAAVEAWNASDRPDDALPSRILVGRLALAAGDLDEAERWLGEALADAEAAGRPYVEALAHYQLGEAALRRGAQDEAERRFERALDGFETYHAPSETMLASRALARLALADGRLADADRRFLEAFRHARDERAERHLVGAAVGRARVAWLRGHARFAVGILDAAREHPAVDRDTLDAVAATMREIEAAHGAREVEALRRDVRTVRVEDAEDAPTGIAGRFGRSGRGARR